MSETILRNILLSDIQLEGIVTLTVRDAETLEEKRSYTEKNTISSFARNEVLLVGNPINATGFSSPLNNLTGIIISDSVMEAFISRFAIRAGVTFTIGRDSVVTAPFYNSSGTPHFFETKQRFNAPLSNRTIRVVCLGGNTSGTANVFVLAMVSLAVPCSQTTTEVLDVTYRIQSFFQTPTSVGFPVGTIFAEGISRSFLDVTSVNGSINFPLNVLHQVTKVSPSGLYIGWPGLQGEQGLTSTRTTDRKNMKLKYAMSFTTIQEVGTIFSTLGYSFGGGSFNSGGAASSGGYRTAIAPATPTTFVNKPIQPIFKHSAAAVSPYLDVNFLATSTGSITMNGSAWTNPDWPEFYRVTLFNSGAVGTARYAFAKRNIIRTEPTFTAPNVPKYDSSYVHDTFEQQHSATSLNVLTAGNFGFHDDSSTVTYAKQFRRVEYNLLSMVHYDSTGVTLLNHMTGNAVSFHAGSSPVLNALSIGQVAVDDSGNIWVADRSTGLYKITAPFGVPTVTHFTNATHGIPLTGETACYGVTAGFGARMWAMFDGALSRTDNGGTTWTNHTPSLPLGEEFSFTGITNSLWANVGQIHADREASNHELGIGKQDQLIAPAFGTIVWWRPGLTATTGPTYRRRLNNVTKEFKVSRYGSTWVGVRDSSNPNTYVARFGTTTTTTIFHTGGNNREGIPFGLVYDNYNVPYPVLHSDSTITRPGLALYTTNGLKVDNILFSFSTDNTLDFGAAQLFSSEQVPNGVIMLSNSPVNGGVSSRLPPHWNTITPYQIAEASSLAVDAYNARYSPFEDVLWKKYHWNGAAWVLGYHATATDTSTFPYNAHGTRKNFDTEDHTFTGRAIIDASVAFPASAFAGNATFAFRIIPQAKLQVALASAIGGTAVNRQEPERVLISIEDSTQRFRVYWSRLGMIAFENSAGTITNLGSTPADGGTYRVVVILSGTTVSVYRDGVQVGSNVTVTAYDFSNPSGALKCHIGSRVYPDWQTRTPMPYFFYRGVMTNVQLWNSAWDGTDISNDAAAPTGVIGSEPAANLRARYELTQSLAGLETKTTHLAAEGVLNGLTIAFVNGMSGTSFVATDYLTFGVVDGILKDNAIAFSQESYLYLKPADITFSSFNNSGETNTVPGSAAIVTERMAFSKASIPLSGSIPTMGSYVPGEIADRTTGPSGAISVQGITGNGFVTFKPGNEDMTDSIFGVTNGPTDSVTVNTNIDYGLRFQDDGTVDVWENGAVPAGGTNVASGVLPTEEFKIERVGTTITYIKVTGGPTLLYTSLVASTGTLYGRVFWSGTVNGACAFHGCTINYSRPAYVMTVGKPSTNTGFYHTYFVHVESDLTSAISILINAVPATVIISDTYMEGMTAPAAGQVVVNGDVGWLVFHASASGATITGNVTVITDRV